MIQACNCGSQTPGLHGPSCVRTSSLFGDLNMAPVAMLLQNISVLRMQRAVETNETIRVSLQLMLDDVIAELDRRNRHVLAESATRGSAS